MSKRKISARTCDVLLVVIEKPASHGVCDGGNNGKTLGERERGKTQREIQETISAGTPAVALENKGALYNHRLDVFQSLYTFYRLTYFG